MYRNVGGQADRVLIDSIDTRTGLGNNPGYPVLRQERGSDTYLHSFSIRVGLHNSYRRRILQAAVQLDAQQHTESQTQGVGSNHNRPLTRPRVTLHM